MGARVLMIDEDTAATNFLIRDARMAALVEAAKEPITPFVHRVKSLFTKHGVSTILVGEHVLCLTPISQVGCLTLLCSSVCASTWSCRSLVARVTTSKVRFAKPTHGVGGDGLMCIA